MKYPLKMTTPLQTSKKKRGGGGRRVFPTLIYTRTNSILAVCHSNYAIIKFQAEWRWRAFGRCSVCHSLLQMLWPMLLWVTESERPWSVYTLGSVTLEPAGNVSIRPTVSFIHWFIPKKNTWKHPKRISYRGILQTATCFSLFCLLVFKEAVSSIGLLLSGSKLCTFIPDLFNGWVEPRTYAAKLKSLPSLSDICGRDQSP